MNEQKILMNTLDLLTRQVDKLTDRVESLSKNNEDLRKENRDLVDMIERLKKAPTLYPPISPVSPSTPQPSWYSWYGNCPKCGLKLDQTMGYVCSTPQCPTGLGGVQCSTVSGPGR